jgi:hypothetical protein
VTDEPIREWINSHLGPDWAVLIIAPDLNVVFISEGLVFRGSRPQGPEAFAGIHVRDLLVVADLDVEAWKPDLVAALTSGVGARHVPYS